MLKCICSRCDWDGAYGDLDGADVARPLEEPRRIWEIFACDEVDVDVLPGIEMQVGDRSSTEIIDEVEVDPSFTALRHGVQCELAISSFDQSSLPEAKVAGAVGSMRSSRSKPGRRESSLPRTSRTALFSSSLKLQK
jgi:hypothetical protein